MSEENTPETLSSYGKEFQTKAISAILVDRAFLERIYDILSADFFEQDAQKWIVKKLVDYFTTYKTLITLTVFGVEANKLSDEILRLSIMDNLKAAYKQSESTDLPFVKEQFLEFCKHQKIKNAIYDSLDLLKTRNFDTIKSKFDDALKAGVERNIGHDYSAGFDLRMSASCRLTIKTNWDLIDKLLDGGLGAGELGFVIAPAGIGKSWCLNRLGAEALRQGKNVMHFTMELNENYVGLRYDACFSKIPFQDVRKNPDNVKTAIKDIKGKLFIKYFPLKTITANTLKMHIERVQMVTGIKIDMMIVDYADLLRPGNNIEKNANSYTEGGAVYEELRAVAGELQIPCWSASQSQRSMADEEIIGASGVADSYKKIMTGDFIISISRKMEDKFANTARLHVIKNRFGADGQIFPCNFNTSYGEIEIYDASSIEGMEILKKAKGQQENVKNIIRKKWKETHDSEE